MKTWLNGYFLLTLLLLLAGCSDPPQLDAVKKQLAAEIPQGWQVTKFKVEASEDAGSKVEPLWQYRIAASIAPQENLHYRVGSLLDTDILEIAQKKNQQFQLHGIAYSALDGGQWRSRLDLQSVPPFRAGQPASAFSGQHVVQGSSGYKKLLKQAKAALTEQQARIAVDEEQLTKGIARYNELNRELQEKTRLSAEHLATLQQQFSQQRSELQQHVSSQSRELSSQLQAERQQQTALFKQEYDKKVAETDAQHRLASAGFAADRTRARENRQMERNKLRDAFAADTSNARQNMARADYTVYKAQSDEKLRLAYQQVESQYQAQLAGIKKQEDLHNATRRNALDSLTAAYRQQVAALNEQQSSLSNTARAELNQQQQDTRTKLDSELQQARNSHQALLQDNNRQLSELRGQLDRLQRQVSEAKNKHGQQSQLLARLESKPGN
ncbi:hypothetical protein WG68_11745 [Arsukibacterium ikkense]|uniref:Lipoprotein n=1 Tax=Arsukibacterium ikkense TaxID=336831 RepID=A0A0M2V2P5_9GAMM|nr:hypothetical protein [Arsukibacterium ikkense]KKO45102.1 hypothetical protein WG68_11745 [Arsukibacterium ikkense]